MKLSTSATSGKQRSFAVELERFALPIAWLAIIALFGVLVPAPFSAGPISRRSLALKPRSLSRRSD